MYSFNIGSFLCCAVNSEDTFELCLSWPAINLIFLINKHWEGFDLYYERDICLVGVDVGFVSLCIEY